MIGQADPTQVCVLCQGPLPPGMAQCPHCAMPANFPNVRAVSSAPERQQLESRWEKAREGACAAGCEGTAVTFQRAVEQQSSAVISRSVGEALRLAQSDDEAYSTYYRLLHAGTRLPSGDKWDRLRMLSDIELFGIAAPEIRFAALSLTGRGLPHYGEVSLMLASPMIAHRTTLFWENSAVHFERARNKAHEPPVIPGLRGVWPDRGKLAVAKHARELRPGMTEKDFADILLRAGAKPEEDVFIEVHIYGSLTRRSLTRMTVSRSHPLASALVQELRDRLAAVGVHVEAG